jgi:uncharacterized protein YktB (UPF0637 family)
MTSAVQTHFKGFSPTDFDTFAIVGLEARMEAIRERIQPKFQQLGSDLLDDISLLAGHEMHLHVAKHARRKVNPPKDTWMALCHNKRGYKQHPHFQIGLFDDHLFMWFALIYELPDKKLIAEALLKQARKTKNTVPQSFKLSFDHMNKAALSAGSLNEAQWKDALIRFRDVKSAELLIGCHVAKGDPLLQDPASFVRTVKETFKTLMPIYHIACL